MPAKTPRLLARAATPFVLALAFLVSTPVRSQQTPPAPSPNPAPAPPPISEPVPPPPEGRLDLPVPPDEPPAASEQLGEISLDDWTRDDWALVQPKVTLLELDGYFRFRGDLFRKLDFDNGTELERPLSIGGEQVPRYAATDDGQASFTSTNMRLRLEPTLNITDSVSIVTTFDVLDNLVLGSTPNNPYVDEGVPVNVLADGQEPQRRGENAINDALVVRRAYANVSALNEQLVLSFGRMPSHWGLGVLSNDGDCLDCDFGDVVDRIELTFKAADLMFIPAYDWVSSGPVVQPFGRSGGQPIDAITWDDVEQYSLRVLRLDDPTELRERVLAGEKVFNYGMWILYRRQFRDAPDAFYTSADFAPGAPVTGADQRRDANIFTGDLYLTLDWGELTLGAEGVAVWGSFRDTVGLGTDLERTQLYQLGAALEATWRFKGEYQGTALGVKAGGATGDSDPFFGALDRSATQRGAEIDGEPRLNNFQFSPDYHVDLLLFRRIIGSVTDAWYVRPEVSHTFDNSVTGSFAAVYSQAIFKRSTPGNARPMGLELDAELAYGSDESPSGGAFQAAFAGGILFPFGAFRNLAEEETEQGGSFAWTLQGRLYITF